MKKSAFLFLAAVSVLLAVACYMVFLKRTAPQTAEDYQTRGLEMIEPQTIEPRTPGLPTDISDDSDNPIDEYIPIPLQPRTPGLSYDYDPDVIIHPYKVYHYKTYDLLYRYAEDYHARGLEHLNNI